MSTYMKLLAQGSKRHLVKPGQLEDGTALCGCIVMGKPTWRRISALEGDECPKYAELAFWGSSPPAEKRKHS